MNKSEAFELRSQLDRRNKEIEIIEKVMHKLEHFTGCCLLAMMKSCSMVAFFQKISRIDSISRGN